VIGGNVLPETEAVEQRLLPDLPLAHHRHALYHQESGTSVAALPQQPFQQNPPEADEVGSGRRRV
jgi:hypothetical protein